MLDFKYKLLYCLVLVVLLLFGIGVGYLKTANIGENQIKNNSILEIAQNYSLMTENDMTVTASTKTYDVTVVYEDYYTVCKEAVTTSKVEYGTTLDSVKEKEKKYQEGKGLVYEIKEEKEDKVVYSRNINQNCPNHFKIIKEDEKINVYSIQGENKSTLYMKIDNINIEKLRDELKQMVNRGTYINSREELNRFIEDLES